jgi:glycerol-3-phosphate dehydrogenase
MVMAGNGALDARDRGAMLTRLAAERFDVLVIGGGITGAGAALDAASRGLRVALVESRDLASGTSSRSSKLILGGLRYLEQFDFKLVYEALRERDLLVSKLAPHLVKPISFMYPLYKKVVERPYVGAGLVLYDSMEGTRRPVPRHKHLTARSALKRAPALSPERLAGAMLYYDAQVDDARHTLTVARTAAAHSAVVATRVSATGLTRDGGGRGRGDLRGRVDRPGARAGRGEGGLPGADVQGRAYRGAAGGGGREHRDDRAHREERAVLHPVGRPLDRRHHRHRLERGSGRARAVRG